MKRHAPLAAVAQFGGLLLTGLFLSLNGRCAADEAAARGEPDLAYVEQRLADYDKQIAEALKSGLSTSQKIGDLRAARMEYYRQVVPSLADLLAKCQEEQEAIAHEAGPPAVPAQVRQAQVDRLRRLIRFVDSIGIQFVYIRAGEFDMGSPRGEEGRAVGETRHHVKITKPFLMATTTVTQAQWKAVMGTSPSEFQGDDRPVEKVSWDDAVAFCMKLSGIEGKRYRLPTEAQWEYACRAGSQTPYGSGDKLENVAWYAANSNGQTHPVAQKLPNAWGLFDMHGNVEQWCADGFADYSGDAVDPKGPPSSAFRVQRGGAWCGSARFCRAASRTGFSPDEKYYDCGFRVCLDFELTK